MEICRSVCLENISLNCLTFINTLMNSMHISTVRKILMAPEPVSLKCWTKSGAILCLNGAIPLKYNFYEGTQQFKLVASREIRTVRVNLIFELNNTKVFL